MKKKGLERGEGRFKDGRVREEVRKVLKTSAGEGET